MELRATLLHNPGRILWKYPITPKFTSSVLRNFVGMVLESIPIESDQIRVDSDLLSKSSFCVHSGHYRNSGAFKDLNPASINIGGPYPPYLNKILAFRPKKFAGHFVSKTRIHLLLRNARTVYVRAASTMRKHLAAR